MPTNKLKTQSFLSWMKTDQKDRVGQNLQQKRLRGYLSTEYGQKCGVHHGCAWVQSMEGSISWPYVHFTCNLTVAPWLAYVLPTFQHFWRFVSQSTIDNFCQIAMPAGCGSHLVLVWIRVLAHLQIDLINVTDSLTDLIIIMIFQISKTSYRSSPSSQC